MLYGNHLLYGPRVWSAEIPILALTPGIPFEWVIHAGNFGSVRSSELKRMLAAPTEDQLSSAQVNASSIDEQDAFAMMKLIRQNYRGVIPLYSQLWLQASPLTDAAIAKALGIKAARVTRWRHATNFDPVTGVRLP